MASRRGVNYGPEANDELKPKPNPQARQLHPELWGPKKDEETQPKTIGDALEEAARKCSDKKLELKDVRAIQSAEARATGVPSGVLGGPAAFAYNLLQNNENATLGEALKDAKQYLPADKIATERDAGRVTDAETRNDPSGQITPNAVAACVQEAADFNAAHGFVPPISPTSVPIGQFGRGMAAGGRPGVGFEPASQPPAAPRATPA